MSRPLQRDAQRIKRSPARSGEAGEASGEVVKGGCAMTDAEFKKLVAEIMDYTDRHSKSKTYYRNAGYRKLEARWPKGCRDCGCTEPEFYMARNDLWIKAGRIGSRHGRLCVSCFERRLGRPVSDGDLGPDGITTEDHEGMTVSEWRTKAGNP